MATCSKCGKHFLVAGIKPGNYFVCQGCNFSRHKHRIVKKQSNRDLLIEKYKNHLDRMSDEDVSKILKKVSKND